MAGQQNGNLSYWNYLAMRAELDVAAVLSKLLFPDLVEVQNCILLAEQFDPATFATWQQQFPGEEAKIEAVMNHVHVYDLFLNAPQQHYPLELYEYLARVLLQCWRQTVEAQFPDRTFVFELTSEPEDYGPTLTFYQQPQA
jgi:hypothetical protein